MRTHTSLEPLEARVAPAILLTFMDADGDRVDVVSNKALQANVSFTAGQNPAELLITGAGLDGANLSVLVKRGTGGDGVVNIGRIVATGLDLGAVSVKGDLGKIVAGNAGSPLPAIKSLSVRSMGILGTDTQGGGNLTSTITGDVGALTVAGDVLGARLEVNGKIGTVKIGGDLRGTAVAFGGRITASSVGSLTIGGDLAAGAGDETGKIIITGTLGALTIGGSLYGAVDGVADSATGQITVSGNAGPITIKRDLFGAGSQQKALDLRGNAGAITIGGSLLGLGGKDSAAIYVTGNTGAITIGRDLSGGSGENSGSLFITGNTGPVKIGGSIVGSTGKFSAAVAISGNTGGFSVGGDVRGGTGDYGNLVVARQIKLGDSSGPVRIGGDLVGAPSFGGGILVMGNAKSFFLGGSILGSGFDVMGVATIPAGAAAMGKVGSATVLGGLHASQFGGGTLAINETAKLLIRGSLVGREVDSLFPVTSNLLDVNTLGTGRIEGSIVGAKVPGAAGFAVELGGNIKKLEILGSLDGGVDGGGGSVYINGNPAQIKIGGELRSGFNTDTGALVVNGRIGSLAIGGGIIGNPSGPFTTAQVTAVSYGKVMVGGDLIGGVAGAGELRATLGGFDAITIKGSLYAGNAGGAITAAKGLGVVKIGGSISGGFAMNHNSIIGLSAKSITIGGDLIANGGGKNSLLNIRLGAGAVKIGGDIRGNAAEPARLIFALTAGYSEPGFTSLMVKGSVTNGLITGGIRNDLVVENADPKLGAVTIGGDWVASTIAAGVDRGADMRYGTADDTVPATGTTPIARIAAITIKGQVLGTTAAGDHFGFVAQGIGPVKIASFLYTAGATPLELSPLTDDVTLRLV